MIVGHRDNILRLKDMVKKGTYSHAYLFVGPEKIGKFKIAKFFGQTILCEKLLDNGNPCQQCPSCNLALSNGHPDCLIYQGGETLGIDEVRNLIHFLDLKPYQSKKKIAIIENADRMTVQAANSFLKTLEEPSENTVIVLTTSRPESLPETIISRVQKVNFGLLATEEIKKYLAENYKLNDDVVEKTARRSNGQIGVAIGIAENPTRLEEQDNFIDIFSQTLNSKSIVEKFLLAEKMSADKDKLIEYFDFLEGYYHQVLASSKKPEEFLLITSILDKIARSKDLIRNNVNPKLATESLMVAGV